MKIFKAAAIGAAGIIASSVFTPVVASANGNPSYTLINTAGLGAYPRSQPVFSARTGSASPEGTQISASCWLYGETVTNPYDYSSNVWVRDSSGQYWSEVWLDTGSDGVPPGLAACASPAAQSASTPNLFYNRTQAVKWALESAPHDPSRSYPWVPACTWFVSNALWQGGFPQDATWTSAGSHNRVRQVQGSVTAWSVPDFYSYVTDQGRFNVTTVELTPGRFRSNAMPEAEAGDLIVYDWEGDGNWDHFSLVTSIAPGQYPEVSEWGVNNDYVKRGWTHSINEDGWLQETNPNMTAELIHINGGIWLPEF